MASMLFMFISLACMFYCLYIYRRLVKREYRSDWIRQIESLEQLHRFKDSHIADLKRKLEAAENTALRTK